MLEEARNIFIVGIKGVAMANLALILKKMGKMVSGSDVAEEFITDELLKQNSINVLLGFEPENLPPDVDLIVYSASHGGDENPLVLEAKKRQIRVVSQAELLGELMLGFRHKIAVCGSHGKTTTASLLAYSLIQLKAKPSYLVGSSSFNDLPGGDYNGDNYFVIEADEYGVNPPKDKTPKFNFLNPDIILCTNIDFDHPDVYEDLEQVKKAFAEFFKKGKIVLNCQDNPDLIVENVRVNEHGTSFELTYRNKPLGQFTISLFGERNASNAAGVVITLMELGFELEQVKSAIKGFTGAKRRFEQKLYEKDIYLFDDYAHHPAEIETTIKTAKERFKNRRIIVIFQPHTYSRTKALLDGFRSSLQMADLVFLAPIFPSARENPKDFSISSADIIKEAACGSKEEILNKLKDNLKAGDVIFTMGAGDIYKLDNGIIELTRRL